MITHKLRWLWVGLLCLALWPGKSYGQSSELPDAFNRYRELYEQGRYQEALPFAEKALRLGKAEFGPDHPNTATFLNNLAALYQAQGRYADAEPLYQRALAINEKALGPWDPHVTTALDNLAANYEAQGEYAEAEPLYQRALAIAIALGPHHLGVAEILNKLADLSKAQGRGSGLVDRPQRMWKSR